MSERTEARGTGHSVRDPWLLLSLAALVAILACIGLAAAPTLFKGATLRSDLAEQVRSTTGLTLIADGSVRFRLFPQPHVEMTDLHLADGSGRLAVEAQSLQGNVRFLPLLVGRLEIGSAVLDHPRLRIDLDAGAVPADSAIGRALHAAQPGPTPGNQRLGTVTLVNGTAILKSKTQPRDILLDAVNVTLDWRNLDAPATLTGAVTFAGVDADVAAWVAQPSSLLRGETSAITLRVHSDLLDLSTTGEFASSPSAKYRGRVTASAPSLPKALLLAGIGGTWPAPFADLALTSDAAISGGTLDLLNLRLRLDDNSFEGTLAYQSSGTAPTLSGTLATEQLSLAPFAGSAPPLLDAERQWSRDKVRADLRDDLHLDLRVSATHMRLAPYLVDDAALSVMTRGGRTDVALVEGKTYGGALKGHASIGLSPDGFSVRAVGTLTDADASALSWDLFGRQLAAGSLSLSANLEGAGDSADAMVRSLRGWVKGKAKDGELSGTNIGLALQDQASGRGEDVAAALRKGRTPFEDGGSCSAGLRRHDHRRRLRPKRPRRNDRARRARRPRAPPPRPSHYREPAGCRRAARLHDRRAVRTAAHRAFPGHGTSRTALNLQPLTLKRAPGQATREA